MKILGIDQSYTKTGIVIIEDGDVTHCELFKTEKPKDPKNFNAIYHRAFMITEHIKKIAEEHKPDFVGLEGLAFGQRGNATRDLAGLLFVLCVDLNDRLGYDIEVISPKSVKKFATGSGNSDKGKMIECLPEDTLNKFLDLGVKKTTGLADLADAYWVGLAAEPTYTKKLNKKIKKGE